LFEVRKRFSVFGSLHRQACINQYLVWIYRESFKTSRRNKPREFVDSVRWSIWFLLHRNLLSPTIPLMVLYLINIYDLWSP
jgi:hypothetical protein